MNQLVFQKASYELAVSVLAPPVLHTAGDYFFKQYSGWKI
jgi:hypothetical protein